MNCAALAPVPMTATRLPARSTSARQRAEWNDGPANESMPSMSGIDGRLSCPTAETTAWASTSLAVPLAQRRWSVQRPHSSDHSIDSTDVLNRIRERRSWASAKSLRYWCSTSWVE
jgi:hypothetical protein